MLRICVDCNLVKKKGSLQPKETGNLGNAELMRNAFLLRTPDRHSAVVLLRSTLAVVHAELTTPFTAEQFASAQVIHAMAPIAADVELGPYDMNRTRFTHCTISVDLPFPQQAQATQASQAPQKHERVDYARRRRKFG